MLLVQGSLPFSALFTLLQSIDWCSTGINTKAPLLIFWVLLCTNLTGFPSCTYVHSSFLLVCRTESGKAKIMLFFFSPKPRVFALFRSKDAVYHGGEPLVLAHNDIIQQVSNNELMPWVDGGWTISLVSCGHCFTIEKQQQSWSHEPRSERTLWKLKKKVCGTFLILYFWSKPSFICLVDPHHKTHRSFNVSECLLRFNFFQNHLILELQKTWQIPCDF